MFDPFVLLDSTLPPTLDASFLPTKRAAKSTPVSVSNSPSTGRTHSHYGVTIYAFKKEKIEVVYRLYQYSLTQEAT